MHRKMEYVCALQYIITVYLTFYYILKIILLPYTKNDMKFSRKDQRYYK